MTDNADTLDEYIDCVAWVQGIDAAGVADIKQTFKQIEGMSELGRHEFSRLCDHMPGLNGRMGLHAIDTSGDYREAVIQGKVWSDRFFSNFKIVHDGWIRSHGWQESKKRKSEVSEILDAEICRSILGWMEDGAYGSAHSTRESMLTEALMLAYEAGRGGRK